MAVVPLILAALVSVINGVLAIRQWRLSRKDRKAPPAHPLEPALRDIATAIREGQRVILPPPH